MDNPDDMFRLAFVNGHTRVLMLDRSSQQFIQRGLDGYRDDVDARSHDLARSYILQLQKPFNRNLLEAFQVTFAAAGLQDELQFFRRVPPCAMAAQTQCMRQTRSRSLDDIDERQRDAVKDQE